MTHRGYAFTTNNWTDEDCVDCLALREVHGARFLRIAFEVGETGTPHIQGFVYWDGPRDEMSVRSWLPRSHVEPTRGSVRSNIEYCSKGPVYEDGDRPTQGRITYERLVDVIANPKDNVHLFMQYRKAYNEIQILQPPSDHSRKLYILHHCFEHHPMLEAKKMNKLIHFYEDVYMGEPISFQEANGMILDSEILHWKNGFPHKRRNGYEVRYYDPEVIYVFCLTEEQEEKLLKKYKDIVDIDHDWS